MNNINKIKIELNEYWSNKSELQYYAIHLKRKTYDHKEQYLYIYI